MIKSFQVITLHVSVNILNINLNTNSFLVCIILTKLHLTLYTCCFCWTKLLGLNNESLLQGSLFSRGDVESGNNISLCRVLLRECDVAEHDCSQLFPNRHLRLPNEHSIFLACWASHVTTCSAVSDSFSTRVN